jgi:mRNA-degrading endonuclease RelE of RelBE toxin-antitoxin system
VKTEFRDSFGKDLKAIKDKRLLRLVKEAIEAIENADSFADLPNVKRLKGSRNYFRQRLGD